MMEGYKTYTGIIIGLLPTILHLFGWHLAPGASDQIGTAVDDIVQILGLAFAFYGRMVASVPGWLAKDAPVASAQ